MTTIDQRETVATLRAFVRDNFLYLRPDFVFADDESLLRRGVIDSLGILELVGFIEERWQINVDPNAITEAQFGSLQAIARYIAQESTAVPL